MLGQTAAFGVESSPCQKRVAAEGTPYRSGGPSVESKRVKPDDGSTRSLDSMSEMGFSARMIGLDLAMGPHHS